MIDTESRIKIGGFEFSCKIRKAKITKIIRACIFKKTRIEKIAKVVDIFFWDRTFSMNFSKGAKFIARKNDVVIHGVPP